MSARARLVLIALALAGCDPPATPTARGTVIGSTSVAIDTRMTTTRTGEAAVGNFLADTLLDAARAMGGPVDVALLNAGAIRGGRIAEDSVPVSIDAKLGRVYPPGDLTDFDVGGWYPFRDNHVVLTVTAAELASALERGAAQLPPDLADDQGGPLLHIGGGAYTIDCAGQVQLIDVASGTIAREGTRIARLEIGGVVLYDRAAGIDLLATTQVRVFVNSFVAKGFDGHLAFLQGVERQLIPYDMFRLADALVARVESSSPIAPVTEGRITVIGDCGQPLTLPQQ